MPKARLPDLEVYENRKNAAKKSNGSSKKEFVIDTTDMSDIENEVSDIDENMPEKIDSILVKSDSDVESPNPFDKFVKDTIPFLEK